MLVCSKPSSEPAEPGTKRECGGLVYLTPDKTSDFLFLPTHDVIDVWGHR